MIGAHDTFTYLNCENAAINLFKKYWRCQTKSPQTLYNNYGVRFFDVRVCRNNTASVLGIWGKIFKKKKFTWATAHGLAEFKQGWKNLEELFKWMKTNFPEAQYRLVLERCSGEEVNQFNSQISKWVANNGALLKQNNYRCSWIGIKTPWTQKYYDSSLYPKEVHDYCCRLFNWDTAKSLNENIKNFRADYTLEKWAKKFNPVLTQEQKNDPNVLYFADYIGEYGIK